MALAESLSLSSFETVAAARLLHFQLFCSAQLLDEEGQKQLAEMAENLSKLSDAEKGSAILRMEDCEAFKCEVVSMGRKAYDLVAQTMRKVDEE